MGSPRRQKPIKYDAELGLRLYGPTPANDKFRIDFVDPFTGERQQRSRKYEAEAFALWDDTVEYLRTVRNAAAVPATATGRGEPTMDDLFEARVQRWEDEGLSEGYIYTRQGRYDYRLRPVFGDWSVREWAASSDGCREVLRSARVQGLAPSSVQDLGALNRGLVTLGWELRWIPPGHNPMKGVRYVAPSNEEGQAPEFVREEDRPEFTAVEKLILAYEELAEETGILWLPERTLVGAYGGLRPGERDALRICDLRPDKLCVTVDGAFTWPRGRDGPARKPPKNGKRRHVLLPGSTMDRLMALADRRRARGAASDALLFEDPRQPGKPIHESATRRLHIDAALRAGWETVEIRRRRNGENGDDEDLGPDLRPRHSNYSLRHHAAVWMNGVAGFEWADVSRALGHHSVAFTYAVYVRSGAEADKRNRARLRTM